MQVLIYHHIKNEDNLAFIHLILLKMTFFTKWVRATEARKFHQIQRLVHKIVPMLCLFLGATAVAGSALLFAKMAGWALMMNQRWVQQFPYLAWIALPLGLPAIVFLTHRFAPYTSGSGIPQVIASLAMPYGKPKKHALRFRQTLYKIPLTFFGMLLGASIGREGPSVQVGAAVMASWGRWCKKRGWAFKGLQENDLLAAGAAGGLAAAFNAPLAGVIFAIEELGRNTTLRWERQIFLGILAAGFVQIALMGNHPYFSYFHGSVLPNMFAWTLVIAAVCGVAGGLFGQSLLKGIGWIAPVLKNHPFGTAALMGIFLAGVGTLSGGDTYGTGYTQVLAALQNNYDAPIGVAVLKWLATVFSYWAGIPGGIFTPSLTIGAMLGHTLASWGDLGIYANVLVLLGMTAFLAAATQSPLTASVVVMEMTGSQSILVWLLLAGLVATVISRQFCPKPFYHAASVRFKQKIANDCALLS